MFLKISRYTPSASITISSNNQVVSGLDFSVSGSGTPCIQGTNHSNVTIQKCRIHFDATARGINLTNCAAFTISDCEFISDGIKSGDFGTENSQSIRIYQTTGGAAADGGGTGGNILRIRQSGGNFPKIEQSSGITLQHLELINPQGTQYQGLGGGISFDGSDSCALYDFYIKSDLKLAWTGDLFNVDNNTAGTFAVPGTYGNHVISRGLIDGGNCTVGAGIQLQDCTGVAVSNVDAINHCNQAFVTDHGKNNSFTTCRARDFYSPCTQGRGLSTAGGTGVAYACLTGAGISSGIVFSGCQYFNLGIAQIHFKDSDSTETTTDITSNNFTPQTPYLWVPVYA